MTRPAEAMPSDGANGAEAEGRSEQRNTDMTVNGGGWTPADEDWTALPGNQGLANSRAYCTVDDGFGSVCAVFIHTPTGMRELPYAERATLIAAAPDLAEAVEPFATIPARINPALPDDTEVRLSVGGTVVYTLALGSLREARAALSKALGQ